MDDTTQVRIKKYPNRRFYDATHSRHVTLADMHDMICAGHELAIVDSGGTDITNLVLTQILIERDGAKLSVLPQQLLHQVIRTRQHMLGSVFEGFIKQMVDSYRSSQEQWTQFLQNTMGMNVPTPGNPMEWTRQMMQTWMPQAPPASPAGQPPPSPQDEELSTLRAQVEMLMKRVEELTED